MDDEIELTMDIAPAQQPQIEDLDYDLDETLSAVATVRAQIPEDAFTAQILGTERSGHATQITESGLFVTIGYVIAEAQDIWLLGNNEQVVPGHVVGYDYETGFGLVQALGQLDLPHIELGDSAALDQGQRVTVAGNGGRGQALDAEIVAKREFAGYWEYVLDEAIFTAPAHPNWGGAALIGADGRLAGIGSLYVENIAAGVTSGNMIVPINLLKPIMNEMLSYGARLQAARPWLGIFVTEAQENLVVAGVLERAPAELADVRAGDVVVGIGGERIDDLATFFRRMWAHGDAGCEIPLMLHRDGATIDINVHSIDRRAQFKTPNLH